MPFWVCWYHVIWATYERQPTITAALEKVVYSAIRAKSNEIKCEVRAVNGMADHVHVAVKIPPAMSVSEWVRQVKGASSFAVNNMTGDTQGRFRWQESYGVLSFGETNLSKVVDYIVGQKEHHAQATTHDYLERDTL